MGQVLRVHVHGVTSKQMFTQMLSRPTWHLNSLHPCISSFVCGYVIYKNLEQPAAKFLLCCACSLSFNIDMNRKICFNKACHPCQVYQNVGIIIYLGTKKQIALDIILAILVIGYDTSLVNICTCIMQAWSACRAHAYAHFSHWDDCSLNAKKATYSHTPPSQLEWTHWPQNYVRLCWQGWQGISNKES